MVAVFIPLIGSVKVTTIGVTTETFVAPLAGETLATTGMVVSTTKLQLSPVDGLRMFGVGDALSRMQLVQPVDPLFRVTV
jgi:hypothetical protein